MYPKQGIWKNLTNCFVLGELIFGGKKMIKKEKKSEIIEKYQKHANDTGSTAVQIAILSERINEINEHLKKNPKDHHGRRGLLMMVGKRKGLMKYLERTNLDEYRELIADLGIRG